MPFIRCTNTPLWIDAQRALGLVLGHRTHGWSFVRTGYMAGEITYCKDRGTKDLLKIANVIFGFHAFI